MSDTPVNNTGAFPSSESAVKKAFRRLLPLLVLIYVLSYVDRVNIGFAALRMNTDLGLTAAMFGFSNTAFYIAYSLFEVPSNMLMERYGARRWIARIMITWGIASIATMFAVGPYSLYSLRALVGLAEAGLMPGILFYIGSWFPQAQRARANALFLIALPLGLVVGAPVSGVILEVDKFLGLEGWRWLFLLEGLPSILIGYAVLFVLPDRPADATWLSAEEKTQLEQRIRAENQVTVVPAAQQAKRWSVMFDARVLAFAFCYFCIIATSNTLALWTPQMVDDLLGKTDRVLLVSLLSMIPPAVSIVAMVLVSAHSDRTGERTWHTVGSMAACGLGWLAVAGAPDMAVKIAGLCLCAAGSKSAYTTFWTMTTQYIARERQAVGIAFISTVGTLASIVSPSIIGILRSMTESFYTGVWYTFALMALGIGAMLWIAGVEARGRTV